MRIRVSIWTILALIGLGAHSLLAEVIRPKYAINPGILSDILGVAPNFLAAGLIFPFGSLMIRDSYTPGIRSTSKSNLNRWFWIAWFGSQLGLVFWELLQKTSGNLVYDANDIGATLLGGAAAIGIYYWARTNYLGRMVKKDRTHGSA